MKTVEFISKIKSGEAKVLTVKIAKQIAGKRIAWMYFGYNQITVHEMIVGDIISEMDFYEIQPCNGYKSRADYWKSYMTKEALADVRSKLILLCADGTNLYIYAHAKYYYFYDEPTFTCSDTDREVYFILI